VRKILSLEELSPSEDLAEYVVLQDAGSPNGDLIPVQCILRADQLGHYYLQPIARPKIPRGNGFVPLKGWPSTRETEEKYFAALDAFGGEELVLKTTTYVGGLLQDCFLDQPVSGEPCEIDGDRLLPPGQVLADINRSGTITLNGKQIAPIAIEGEEGQRAAYRRFLRSFKNNADYTDNLLKLTTQAVFSRTLHYAYERFANDVLHYYPKVVERNVQIKTEMRGITSIFHHTVWGVCSPFDPSNPPRYFKTKIEFHCADRELAKGIAERTVAIQKVSPFKETYEEAECLESDASPWPSGANSRDEYLKRLVIAAHGEERLLPLFVISLLASIEEPVLERLSGLKKLRFFGELLYNGEPLPYDQKAQLFYEGCRKRLPDTKLLNSLLSFCLNGFYEHLLILCKTRFENLELNFCVKCIEQGLELKGGAKARQLIFDSLWKIENPNERNCSVYMRARAEACGADSAFLERKEGKIEAGLIFSPFYDSVKELEEQYDPDLATFVCLR